MGLVERIGRASIVAILICGIASCGKTGTLRWEKIDGAFTLVENGTPLGVLDIPEVEGITHKEKVEALDSSTFKVTCVFKAVKDLDSVLLQASFNHLAKSSFWMIPSVNYNGNAWGKGKEPKGAKENGEWRSVSFRRTPIPGAMYSEGNRYAIATWAETPRSLKENFSCSLRPDESQTDHVYLWPEEELPLTYSNRDHLVPGFRDNQSLRKGETIEFQIYVHATPLLDEHRSTRSFLDKAWELAAASRLEI